MIIVFYLAQLNSIQHCWDGPLVSIKPHTGVLLQLWPNIALYQICLDHCLLCQIGIRTADSACKPARAQRGRAKWITGRMLVHPQEKGSGLCFDESRSHEGNI